MAQHKALDLLKTEHLLISRAVTAMERQVSAIDNGATPKPETIELIVGFSASFIDRRHHGKEETVLFPAIAARAEAVRSGPVKVLTAEHESGRYFVSQLREGAQALRTKDPTATPRIRRALALYAQLLRKHIVREEEIVFLLTEALLSEQELDVLAESFAEHDAAPGGEGLQHAADLILNIEELIKPTAPV